MTAFEPAQFNRDPEGIPESRRRPTLPGMSAGERVSEAADRLLLKTVVAGGKPGKEIFS